MSDHEKTHAVDLHFGNQTREADREDPLGRTDRLISGEIPPGVDRRTFLMRSALIGATAVMLGRSVSAEERTERSTAEPPPLSNRSERREEGEGPRDDDGGRVLQSRAGPIELTHDRPDAHYLRFLPALHQAAGGPTRQGNRAQGSLVSAASAPRAKGTARSAPRLRGWSGRSRQPLIPRFSTACATSLTSRFR